MTIKLIALEENTVIQFKQLLKDLDRWLEMEAKISRPESRIRIVRNNIILIRNQIETDMEKYAKALVIPQ